MKRVNRLSSPRSGFTLLELLIVLAILIVVIGMLGTTVWGQYRKALIRSATIQVTSKLHDALELFKVDQGRYPYATEGLYILANVDNPDPQGAQQKQDEAMAAARQEAGVNNMQNGQGQGQGGDFGVGGFNGDPNGGFGNGGFGNDPNSGFGAGGFGGDQNGGLGNGGFGNDPNGGFGVGGFGGDQNGGLGGDPNGGFGSFGDQNTNNFNNGNGQFQQPQQQQQQQQVYVKPKIIEPYVKEKDLTDPWGQPYRYEWPTVKGDGQSPAVWSCGPDKEDNNGDGDDIISWDPQDTSGVMRFRGQQSGNSSNNMNPMANPGMGGDMANPGMGGDMMNPGMGGDMMNPGMGGDMMNPGMGGGMANPGMGGDMMNPGMGGGMANPGMGGGMANPGMGGGTANPGMGGGMM